MVAAAGIAASVLVSVGGRQALEAQSNVINVTNVEELYAAVNDPGHAGALVLLAPGTYVLTALDPSGGARPNGGRLELQADMGLQGAVDARDAVVIDAGSLPQPSYLAQVSAGLPPSRTGAIRMGRGRNSVEWLTIQNAFRGQAGIDVDLLGTGPTHIHLAHLASTGNIRGMELRNLGPSAAGRVIVAKIVDNDLYDNTAGLGEGIRIVNIQGADGGRIEARLSGNRVHGNDTGLLVVNNSSSSGEISVLSSGDRFFENGAGAIIAGGLSSTAAANGNTIVFEARGSDFSDNNGFTDFDRGGLVVVGAENISTPNGASDNTVRVRLAGCRIEGNQVRDLVAVGARSNPSAIGMPGTNNRVELTWTGGRWPANVETADSIPDDPSWANTVLIKR